MKDYRSAVPGSGRRPHAGNGWPPSRTWLHEGASLWLDSFRSSFRRAAETSTRAACAPQIVAEPSMHL